MSFSEYKADPEVKLRALYKHFPWLLEFKDTIGIPSNVKTARFDLENMREWVGHKSNKSERGTQYWMEGYVFDMAGKCLSELYPSPRFEELLFNYWLRLRRHPGGSKTLEELFRAMDHDLRDRISYILLVGATQSHNRKLELFFVPDGKTVTELLEQYKKDCLARREQEERNAEKEISYSMNPTIKK
jgi:hypothetical protein